MADDVNIKLLKDVEASTSELNKFLSSNESREDFNKKLKIELLYTTQNCYENTLTTRKHKRYDLKLTVKDIEKLITEHKTYGYKPLETYIIARNLNSIYEKILNKEYKDSYKENFSESNITELLKEITPDIDKNKTVCIYDGLPASYYSCFSSLSLTVDKKNLYDMFDIFFKLSKSKNNLILILAITTLNLLLVACGYYPITLNARSQKRFFKNIEKYNPEGDNSEAYAYMLGLMKDSLSKIQLMFGSEKGMNYLSIGEFAKEVGCSKGTIHCWIRLGKLKPAFISLSGYKYFSKDQLNELPKKTGHLGKKLPRKNKITPQD